MPKGIYVRKYQVWNKGKKLNEIKGYVNPFKNKHHLEETKRKIGEKSKGNKNNLGKHWKIKNLGNRKGLKNHLGHKHSEETKKKIREARKKQVGDKSPTWKGGITPINIKIRNSKEFILWRKSVFERDNYTCIWCGIKSGNGKAIILHADHIKPFALFPELRFAIDNGRTLCIDCHKKTDTYGGNTR